MSEKTAKNCEDCAHHIHVIGNELACQLDHKPQWFAPSSPLDRNYGWRMKCRDFRTVKDQKLGETK